MIMIMLPGGDSNANDDQAKQGSDERPARSPKVAKQPWHPLSAIFYVNRWKPCRKIASKNKISWELPRVGLTPWDSFKVVLQILGGVKMSNTCPIMMVNSCVKSFSQIKEMLRQFLGWMRIAPALASECSCPWCLARSCWRHKTRPQQ